MTPGVVLRPGSAADTHAVALAMADGFDGYRAFAPAGWEPPSAATFERDLGGTLGDPEIWSLVAEAGGELVGHAIHSPATRARHPVDDPALAHLRNLFVRADHWGTGLARELHAAAIAAAADRGFTRMRLVTPAQQARARRFYEREGWTAPEPPFLEERLGLLLVEYRRELSHSRV